MCLCNRTHLKFHVANPLQPSGYYKYHRFNIHKFYVLTTQGI